MQNSRSGRCLPQYPAPKSQVSAEAARPAPGLNLLAIERWLRIRQRGLGRKPDESRPAAPNSNPPIEAPDPFDPADTFYEVAPIRRFGPGVSTALRKVSDLPAGDPASPAPEKEPSTNPVDDGSSDQP